MTQMETKHQQRLHEPFNLRRPLNRSMGEKPRFTFSAGLEETFNFGFYRTLNKNIISANTESQSNKGGKVARDAMLTSRQ